MPDDEHGLAMKVGHAGDDRLVVREPAITMELGEAGEQATDVVEHDGPVGMARHEHALPRRQVCEQLCAQFLHTIFETGDRRGPVRRRGHHPQRLDLLEQDCHRLFKFQRINSHVTPFCCYLRLTAPAPQMASTSRTNPSLGRIR